MNSLPKIPLAKIACVIPVRNGGDEFAKLIDAINNQTVQVDLLIVDSGSTDGSFELAQKHAKYIVRINHNEFNHGATRQMVVDANPDYDTYVFFTQDAIPANSRAVECITTMLSDEEIGAVGVRQLPHKNANLLAQHARRFNYPDSTVVKSMHDRSVLGLKTAFISNSFAAYRANALKQVGVVPAHVITCTILGDKTRCFTRRTGKGVC